MTATKTAPAPSTYVSGFCGSRRHERCLGAYVGTHCTCTCHTEPEPEPEPVVLDRPPGPAAQLARAAAALEHDGKPCSVPAPAITHLAALLRSEAAWAADRGDHYPTDRAPLLELADLINGAETS